MIPQTVKLSDVCEIVMGQAPSGDSYNDEATGLPLIAGAGDFKNGIIKVGKYTTEPTKISNANDIVMSIRASIGDKVWVDAGFCLGRGVAAIRASNKIDKNYLWHALTHVEPTLISRGRGATFLQVNKDDIKDLEIPLPTLAEQQRIAELLDTADRILKQRESAIAKLDQLAQSVFVEMFGSINGNEKKFEQMKLTEFFKFKTGKLDSNAAIENGIYPFFTCSKEDFAINEYAFDEEALLLAGNNATADYSVKHYKGKFNAYQRTYVINLAESNNSYAYAKACLQLKLIQLKSVSKGTNTKYLTMGIFREMTMNVPPKNLQIDFEKRIHAIDLVKSKNKEDIKILKKLIDSLQHQSFAVN